MRTLKTKKTWGGKYTIIENGISRLLKNSNLLYMPYSYDTELLIKLVPPSLLNIYLTGDIPLKDPSQRTKLINTALKEAYKIILEDDYINNINEILSYSNGIDIFLEECSNIQSIQIVNNNIILDPSLYPNPSFTVKIPSNLPLHEKAILKCYAMLHINLSYNDETYSLYPKFTSFHPHEILNSKSKFNKMLIYYSTKMVVNYRMVDIILSLNHYKERLEMYEDISNQTQIPTSFFESRTRTMNS